VSPISRTSLLPLGARSSCQPDTPLSPCATPASGLGTGSSRSSTPHGSAEVVRAVARAQECTTSGGPVQCASGGSGGSGSRNRSDDHLSLELMSFATAATQPTVIARGGAAAAAPSRVPVPCGSAAANAGCRRGAAATGPWLGQHTHHQRQWQQQISVR
jgi:hypothetical protein